MHVVAGCARSARIIYEITGDYGKRDRDIKWLVPKAYYYVTHNARVFFIYTSTVRHPPVDTFRKTRRGFYTSPKLKSN